MYSAVSKFIERCPGCQINRKVQVPLPALGRSIQTGARLAKRWHLDLTGAYPTCTMRSHRFIILFVDEVTGFCFLRSAITNCALEVAIALLDLSSMFGVPDSVHSDGGSEFDSDIIHQFCLLSSIKHSISIARAPQTNGVAERHIQEAKRVLRLLVTDLEAK